MGTKKAKEPTEYTIPSREWGITASEAGSILIAAEEIRKNKKCYDAAIADIKAGNEARKAALKKI